MTDSACFVKTDILPPGEGSAGTRDKQAKNGTSGNPTYSEDLQPQTSAKLAM